MIWHYTTRRYAAIIRKEKLIRAYPMRIFRDLMGTHQIDLEPVVWFTTAATPSPTVLVVADVQLGERIAEPGAMWRFGVADDVAPQDLLDWAFERGYDSSDFRFMLVTAHLAGEDFEAWRLCPRDVPAAQWLAVEFFDGTAWQPAEAASGDA